ncbi:hypothetical protein E4U52_006286, partial [Claviceps spartinae]
MVVVQLRAVLLVWPLALTPERFIAKKVAKAQKAHRVWQKRVTSVAPTLRFGATEDSPRFAS